jgi:hypothetical protein
MNMCLRGPSDPILNNSLFYQYPIQQQDTRFFLYISPTLDLPLSIFLLPNKMISSLHSLNPNLPLSTHPPLSQLLSTP